MGLAKHRSSLALTALVILVQVGCGLSYDNEKYVPPEMTITPISSSEDGISFASAVAHTWEEDAYLVNMGSVYDYNIDNQEYVIRHAFYAFVSPSSEQYIDITISASGSLEHHRPADIEGSWIPTEQFQYLSNEIDESEATAIAWQVLGTKIASECLLPTVVSIIGQTINEFQSWDVTYSGNDSTLGNVVINTSTGAMFGYDLNTNVCKLTDDGQ